MAARFRPAHEVIEVNEAAAVCILESSDDVGNIFSPLTLILGSQDLFPERHSLAENDVQQY